MVAAFTLGAEPDSVWHHGGRDLAHQIGASTIWLWGIDDRGYERFCWSSGQMHGLIKKATGIAIRTELLKILGTGPTRIAAPANPLAPIFSDPVAGMVASASIVLEHPLVRIVIGCVRGAEEPIFSQAEANAIDEFKFVLAAVLAGHVNSALNSIGTAIGILDAMSSSAVLFDCVGDVIGVTHRAAEMLARGTPLSVARGRLLAAHAAESREIAATVAALCAAAKEGRDARCSLLIGDELNNIPIDFTTLPGPKGSLGFEPRIAAVFRLAPHKDAGQQISLLRQIFSFTAAEAEVAMAMARGETLADIAVRRHVSRQTIKTQLKQVFAKAGVSRQSELVAVLHQKLGGISGFARQ